MLSKGLVSQKFQFTYEIYEGKNTTSSFDRGGYGLIIKLYSV